MPHTEVRASSRRAAALAVVFTENLLSVEMFETLTLRSIISGARGVMPPLAGSDASLVAIEVRRLSGASILEECRSDGARGSVGVRGTLAAREVGRSSACEG